MQHRLCDLVNDVAACGRICQPWNADTLAAGDQKLGQRKGDDQGSLQLAVA